jgi:hypothetical protein
LNKHLPKLAAVAAVVVSSLALAAPPAHAVSTGTVTVDFVDQYGRPTAGVLEAFNSTGSQFSDGTGGLGTFVFSSTHLMTLPADGYAFEAITPWSGLDCAGVSPCSAYLSSPTIAPVVTVTPGAASAYTIHVTVPTITGGPAVGTPLTIQIPQGLAILQGSLIYSPFGNGPMSQQWLRAGSDIAGATGQSYTTTPLDGLKSMSARLMPGGAQAYVAAIGGGTAQPFTTNAITMSKYTPLKTKTKVKLPKSIGAGDRVSMKVTVKGKGTKEAPTGLVTVKIGGFKVKKTLKDGSVFINMPNLQPGSYTIKTSYAGSIYFAKSKSKSTKITVHK